MRNYFVRFFIDFLEFFVKLFFNFSLNVCFGKVIVFKLNLNLFYLNIILFFIYGVLNCVFMNNNIFYE